jgi:thioredoxin 1
MIVNVTKDTFRQEVLESGKPVIVDFWATWCGPCQMQARIFEELEKTEGDKIKICKVNVDENEELAGQFGIESIPTLLFYKNGNQIGKAVGVRPRGSLLAYLDMQ